MQMVIAIACSAMRLTPAEAIAASTINADVAGQTLFVDGNNWSNSGTLQSSGGTLRLAGMASNGGALNVSAGSMSLINPGPNNGAITVAPGAVLNISGNFAQGASGSLTEQIAGSAANQLGQITISGIATLDGTPCAETRKVGDPQVAGWPQVLRRAAARVAPWKHVAKGARRARGRDVDRQSAA